MKYIVIGLVLCLLFSSAWAGTWSDGFGGEKLDGWRIQVQNDPTTLEVKDGRLSMEVRSAFVSFLRVVDSNQWQNYTLTVRVRVLEIFGSFVDGGIFVHESGGLHNFYYFFIADNWGAKDFKKFGLASYPGTPPEGKGAFVFPKIGNQFKKGKAKVFEPKLNQWYTLKAIAKGNRTEFYVDGDLVGDFNHGELSLTNFQ